VAAARVVVDELGLERVKETLHRSIVIAVSLAAHRRPEAGKAAIYLAGRLSSSCASGWDDDNASLYDSAEFDAGRMFK